VDERRRRRDDQREKRGQEQEQRETPFLFLERRNARQRYPFNIWSIRACASSSAAFDFFWPTSAPWIAVAIVSPIAGHCGTRGRQSTSVSCSSEVSAASTKLGPMSFVIARNSGARHSDARFSPERFAGPANFHEVRACVSAEAAQVMNSHVARFCLSESAALIGKPQFQIDVQRLPVGPFGQRANAILPMTFDFSGFISTAADECASM